MPEYAGNRSQAHYPASPGPSGEPGLFGPNALTWHGVPLATPSPAAQVTAGRPRRGVTVIVARSRTATIPPKGRPPATAYIDDPVDDATAAMKTIAGQLAQAGVRLAGFEKQAGAYRRRRHELESDPKAPDDIAAFLTKTAITIGLAAARDIPVAGSLLAPVDSAGAAEQVNRARTYLARRLRNRATRVLWAPGGPFGR